MDRYTTSTLFTYLILFLVALITGPITAWSLVQIAFWYLAFTLLFDTLNW